MRFKLSKATLATAAFCSLLIAGTVAKAGNMGPYFSASLGAQSMHDSENEFSGQGELEFEIESGMVFSAAIGTSLAENFRIELEGNYRANDLDQVQVTNQGAGFFAVGAPTKRRLEGELESYGLMGNLYIDFGNMDPFGSGGRRTFSPYIMGGLGFSQVKLTASSRNILGAPTDFRVDDEETLFSYQLGAGISFAIDDNISMDFGYRFFTTEDQDYTDSAGNDFKSEYMSHAGVVGLKFHF